MSKFIPDLIIDHKVTPLLLSAGIRTPNRIDLRDKMLPTENQGTTSTCAAHTATSWLENIMWMRTGIPRNYDPYKLYDEAKRIDGHPNEQGTTLYAVMEGLVNLGWFDSDKSNIVCYGNDITNLKRQVHKYGPILAGFNCSELWLKHKGKLYMSGSPGRSCGGHAVIIVGYTDDGVYIQNSWGTSWGKYGFALLSWDLVKSQLMNIGVFKNCLNDLN